MEDITFEVIIFVAKIIFKMRETVYWGILTLSVFFERYITLTSHFTNSDLRISVLTHLKCFQNL
jgi:hypothetical protein